MTKLCILLLFISVRVHAAALCERYVCHATGPGPVTGTAHTESYYGDSEDETAATVVARCARAAGGACAFNGCEEFHGPAFNLFGDGCVDAWSARKR